MTPIRPLLLILAAAAAATVSAASRASTRSALTFVPPATPPTDPQQKQQPPAVAPGTMKPLPLSRRHKAHANRRHAIPPFDQPLDAATIEAMVNSAQGASTSSGMGVGEVTTEQLWVGFIAGVFPFVWAGYEFWKRIDTQQRCGVCQGSGLVYESRSGRQLEVPRKCYACGGFLPWMGWRRFWLSNLDIGNGGILQRPAPDYEALSAEAKAKRARQGEGNEE